VSDEADFDAVLATNVTGAMLMAREAAKHFVRQGSRNIVNISSTPGLRGGAGSSAYSASKFALRALSECWRAELRPSNVRVIQENPSEVITGFGAAAGYAQEASPKTLRPEDITHAGVSALEMHDRGFLPDLSVFATVPAQRLFRARSGWFSAELSKRGRIARAEVRSPVEILSGVAA
jgi:3-oxoacyl-[acyl-carrier protein] reductase